MSGTCSVRTENAGTSMSVSIPNASRADHLGVRQVDRGGGANFGEGGNLVHRPSVSCVQSWKSLTPRTVARKCKSVRAWRVGSTGGGHAAVRGDQARAHRRIGEIDRLQAFLGRPVAAVGVRMVPLGQLLVARLHRVQRGRPGQARASPAARAVPAASARGSRAGAARSPGRRPAVQRVAQQRPRPRRGAAEPAERPGRALPGGVGAQLRLDLAGDMPL